MPQVPAFGLFHHVGKWQSFDVAFPQPEKAHGLETSVELCDLAPIPQAGHGVSLSLFRFFYVLQFPFAILHSLTDISRPLFPFSRVHIWFSSRRSVWFSPHSRFPSQDQ
ncbi:hypothetical protein ES703_48570 [subsurface metagenome]